MEAKGDDTGIPNGNAGAANGNTGAADSNAADGTAGAIGSDAGAPDGTGEALDAGSWDDTGDGLRPSYRDEVLADNPLAYWRLGEATGATAHDELGHYDGTYQAVTLNVGGALAGDPNGAVQFTGSSSAIVVADVLGLEGSTPFTLEAWVNPSVVETTYHRILTKRATVSGLEEGWSLLHNSDKHLSFEAYAGGEWAGGHTAESLAIDSYSHVVVTYDGGTTLCFYVNSLIVETAVTAIALRDNPANLVIGSVSAANGNSWRGALDEVAIYGTALSSERIAVHYQRAKGL